MVTAAASSQISTKLAPTLPLRRTTASAAALKLKIALKSWSLVFTAATANLEFLGILDFCLGILVYKEKIKKVPKTAIEFFDAKSRDRKTRSAVSNFKALQTTKASKDRARIDSNKNKLKSAENIKINEEYFESNAIPILDYIQNNPNAISEMQDNLKEF